MKIYRIKISLPTLPRYLDLRSNYTWSNENWSMTTDNSSNKIVFKGIKCKSFKLYEMILNLWVNIYFALKGHLSKCQNITWSEKCWQSFPGFESGGLLPQDGGHVCGDEVAEEAEKQSGFVLGLESHVILELHHLHVHSLHQCHRSHLLPVSRYFAKLERPFNKSFYSKRSMTKFDEISPFWQRFQKPSAILCGFFSSWAKFWT